MNDVKKHFFFDMYILFAAGAIGISSFLLGQLLFLLVVGVLTPTAFILHFLVIFIIGLVKRNNQILTYSFLVLLMGHLWCSQLIKLLI